LLDIAEYIIFGSLTSWNILMAFRERKRTSEFYGHLSLVIFFGIFLLGAFPFTSYGLGGLFYEALFNSYMLSLSGLSIVAFGIVLFVLSYKSLGSKGSPEEESHLETRRLVTSGIYRYVRHPMALAVFTLCFGPLIWKLSIASIAAYIVVILFYMRAQPEEEKDLIDKFGENYCKYRREVPALNIIKGLMRKHN